MDKLIFASITLSLGNVALAAPCVYTGDRAGFITCIADQAGANEDDITLLDAAILDLDARVAASESGFVSVAGISLRTDRPGSALSALSNGAAYASDLDDTFSFAPVQLPSGATIDRFECTIKDEDATGYVQANLMRADLDDPSVFSSDVIASALTFPATNSPDYTRYNATANAALAVVDNEHYTYYLRVDLLDVTATSGNVALQGCSVSFQR